MHGKCEYCGREFSPRSSDVRRGFGRFCSRYCGRAALRKPKGKSTASRTFSKRDGRWYRQWREEGSRRTRKQLESRWMWEREYGTIPDGYDVHHKNHDRSDNRLENFELQSKPEHNAHHQKLRTRNSMDYAGERRRCQRCHEWKPFSEFYPRRDGTYGGYCKPCGAEYLREWRAKQ